MTIWVANATAANNLVRMAGCGCSVTHPEAEHAEGVVERTGEWMRMVFAALVAAQSMIFGLAINISPPSGTARLVVHAALAGSAVLVFLLVGLPMLGRAVRAAARGRVVMEQLFLAGIAGAFFASLHCTLTGEGHVYYEVVAILLAIYTFGQLIGEKRREAALSAARRLGEEFSFCDVVAADGSLRRVPVTEVREGDRVHVAPGGAVPVDGVLVEGVAFVRETALTGEPFPAVRRAGDAVLAGSHVLDNAIELRATAGGGRRQLDAMLDAVRSAQGGASRLQREADRLVAWFLPVVLVVAVLTFIGWTIGAGWIVATFNALAVLVVACPCSMGLATPIGIWSALSSMARKGLVAHDSDFVETLARVDTVVFDKTGTLGEEQLQLVDFVTAEGIDRARLLDAVAALERASNHPVAMAFRRRETALTAEGVSLLPGAGIQGKVAGSLYAVGNPTLLGSDQPRRTARALRGRLRVESTGSHEVVVLRDGEVVALGLLRERLRESSREAMSMVEAMGLRCVVMTGDRGEAAAVHGFRECLAGLSAADKASEIRRMTDSGSRVLFVGDGINDAPAMAAADVSVAVASGSALARETAAADLFGGDLRALPLGLLRCRRAVRAIRHNLYFAAIYNVAGITLAAAGILHPVVAALLMLASSLTVTWQALREAEDGEEEDAPPRRRARTATRPAAAGQAWLRQALPAAILIQGPVVAYLGGFEPGAAIGFCLLFAGAAVSVWLLLRERVLSAQSGMGLTMFSFGGLAMLAGWWADAGFAQIVRDGVCLCGCVDSDMGWGLFAQPSWMAAGMVAASIPAIRFEPAALPVGRIACWLAGLMGMFAGMQASVAVMALIPVGEGHTHFFATFAAMVTGMTMGMLLACWAATEFRRRWM